MKTSTLIYSCGHTDTLKTEDHENAKDSYYYDHMCADCKAWAHSQASKYKCDPAVFGIKHN